MNILVTGGAGFIASHLIDRLLNEGHTVVAYDNLSLGRESNIAHHFGDSAFTFVKGDILDTDLLDSVFEKHKFDFVFHLAANSDIARSHADPTVDLNMTYMTTFRVVDAMRRFGRIIQSQILSDVKIFHNHSSLTAASVPIKIKARLAVVIIPYFRNQSRNG